MLDQLCPPVELHGIAAYALFNAKYLRVYIMTDLSKLLRVHTGSGTASVRAQVCVRGRARVTICEIWCV